MRKADNLIFRKPKNKIEEILKNEMLKRRLSAEVKRERTLNHFMKKLKVLIPIQIVIGIVACFLMYFIFGGNKLVETLLSWTIGMTIIAAFVTSMFSKYKE